MAYATGPAMRRKLLRRSYDPEQLTDWVQALYGSRVFFHRGDESLAAGLSIHHVGGHTPGMQVVRVRTGRGQVVLASDAVHYYENLHAENPFPGPVNTIDYLEALHRVSDLADGPDHIVPGHDPAVLTRYPRARDEMEDVVRLDLPTLEHAA